MRAFILTIAMAALAASFAAPAHAGEDQFFGTLFGMAAGGLIGNQFGHGTGKAVATGVGVVAGGWIGNDLGRAADNARSGYSSAYYAPSYATEPPVYYYNTYNAYKPNYVAPPAAAPEPPVTYTSNGAYCREVSQQVVINGRAQESYGTACLQPDGTWRVVQ
jgi:surface antigen